jgi:hypothetical protein
MILRAVDGGMKFDTIEAWISSEKTPAEHLTASP